MVKAEPAELPTVSVVLPIDRIHACEELGVVPERFHASVCSILDQTMGDFELLLVANGADGETLAEVNRARVRDARCRVIGLPEAGLAAALNAGIHAARAGLIARMDADDWCDPSRLEKQVSVMCEHPELAGLGTGYDKTTPDGAVLSRVIPPSHPGELRWRLLLGNQFAHGSMMLRKDAVLAVGGYDERVRRGQDFDLWLRLIERYDMSNLPEVLYQYRAKPGDDQFGVCTEQAATVVDRLLDRWSSLQSAPPNEIRDALVSVLAGREGPDVAAGRVEDAMGRCGPSAAGLLGWLWILWRSGERPARVEEAGKLSVLREAGRQIRAGGIEAVWLWGAGQHTSWVLEHLDELGLGVLGIIDDAGEGRVVHNFRVAAPADVPAGEVALISSDAWEAQIWNRSAGVRARGVDVRRLYTLTPGAGQTGVAEPVLDPA